MSDSDDFFGGSSKSASFDGQPGITWAGVIDRIGAKVQKREYSPNGTLGALKYYPGTTDPIMQLPITILTDARDPAVPNDDGRRTIYFEGAKRKALIDALKANGLRGPVLGDWMSLEFYATEQGQGSSPKKLYRAQYAINPNPSARGAGYVAPDTDPAALTQPITPHVEQNRTVPAYAQGQPNFGNPNQPAAQASPFTNGAPQDNPANNWPPAGAVPAAAQAPVQETQQQPVAAGAGGPVAQGRPWG